MKITKTTLRRIIKEELNAVLNEQDLPQAYAGIAAQDKEARAAAGGYEAQQKQKFTAKQEEMIAMIANFMNQGAAAAEERYQSYPWSLEPLPVESASLPKNAKAIANIINNAFEFIEKGQEKPLRGSARFGKLDSPATAGEQDGTHYVTFTVAGHTNQPEMQYLVLNKEGGGIKIIPKPERRDYGLRRKAAMNEAMTMDDHYSKIAMNAKRLMQKKFEGKFGGEGLLSILLGSTPRAKIARKKIFAKTDPPTFNMDGEGKPTTVAGQAVLAVIDREIKAYAEKNPELAGKLAPQEVLNFIMSQGRQ